MRNRNTTSSGGGFSYATIEAVWQKALTVNGYDSRLYRKDKCGAWIQRNQYGKTNSTYGWEVDHIQPVSLGGSDELLNLQPLQWGNNRKKGNSYPYWTCAIKAA